MSSPSDKETRKWQLSLLPFLVRTIIVLSAFFFLASLAQLIYLHYVILHRPLFDSGSALSQLRADPRATTADALAVARLRSLVMLEAANLDDQYHQANVLLMGRLWTGYIGFVTGMILAVVGATFILGKLSESASELRGKIGHADLTFRSASPGLVLAVLGTALMLATIVTHHDIEVKHNAVYLRDESLLHLDLPGDPPSLPPPITPTADTLPSQH